MKDENAAILAEKWKIKRERQALEAKTAAGRTSQSTEEAEAFEREAATIRAEGAAERQRLEEEAVRLKSKSGELALDASLRRHFRAARGWEDRIEDALTSARRFVSTENGAVTFRLGTDELSPIVEDPAAFFAWFAVKKPWYFEYRPAPPKGPTPAELRAQEQQRQREAMEAKRQQIVL